MPIPGHGLDSVLATTSVSRDPRIIDSISDRAARPTSYTGENKNASDLPAWQEVSSKEDGTRRAAIPIKQEVEKLTGRQL